MSSRSPRASISGASSAEVAADFEESLKDLQINNRYEISNLTIIAKENTEHAQAISRVLENHIKTTSPVRKLPALYVLDSIVKNVGTPYTVYLGRNLFSTFMDAYTMVDGNTRRNMEGMLKTWKEPVPGSIDPRPVFPAETVRPIENALIKAKTAAIQNQRQVQPQVAFRGTSTPPQFNGQFIPPPGQHAYPGFGSQQHTPQPQSYPFQAPQQPPQNEVEDVKRDIAALISRDQVAFASRMNDQSLRTRLSALLDLQKILNMRSFSPAELQAIKSQVSQLASAAQTPPQHIPATVPSTPQWTAPTPLPPPPQNQFPPPPPPLSANAPILTPDALNGLQALLANTQKPGTPQMRAAMPALSNASHSQLNAIQNHTAKAPTNGATDLLASLAKAGLINPIPNPVPPAVVSAPLNMPLSTDATASLLKSLQSVLPPLPQSSTPSQTPIISSNTNVPLTSAVLRNFRPELVVSLYDAQPNQCNTCGRRFLATDEGRAEKNRHLDWHFRTNQRIADPNTNRGHHRHWYMDEMEWIRHTDFDPSVTTATTTGPSTTAKVKKDPQDQFVRAPAGMTKNTCNICFEEMKSSYSEDLQDWIFPNATTHNKKIVHATCLAEMSKLGHGAGGLGAGAGAGAGSSALAAALASMEDGKRARSATPDSLLGKRKAETSMTGSSARLRIE